MKKYCVQRIEVYRQEVFVSANSPKDAIRRVDRKYEGTEGELHYSYTLEPDHWKVFEV